MEIVSIAHKALRRFFLTGKAKGLVGDVERIRRMLAFVVAAENFDELKLPPNFGLHELTGSRGALGDDRDEELANDIHQGRREDDRRPRSRGLSLMSITMHPSMSVQ